MDPDPENERRSDFFSMGKTSIFKHISSRYITVEKELGIAGSESGSTIFRHLE